MIKICMIMENKNFFAICLLVGLVFLGAMFPTAVSKFRNYDRTVNVTSPPF